MYVEVSQRGVAARFFFPNLDNPGGAAYPFLKGTGAIRKHARASFLSGLDAGETPSCDIILDNQGNQAFSLLGFCLRADVLIVDDDSVIFEGQVSRLTLGNELKLTAEA